MHGGDRQLQGVASGLGFPAVPVDRSLQRLEKDTAERHMVLPDELQSRLTLEKSCASCSNDNLRRARLPLAVSPLPFGIDSTCRNVIKPRLRSADLRRMKCLQCSRFDRSDANSTRVQGIQAGTDRWHS